MAGATSVAPAPAAAATEETEQSTKLFETTFVRDAGRALPITGGLLKLTLTNDGFINGFYTPPGTARLIPVVGGRNGSELWFDIGDSSRATHVTGTLHDGTITGSASESNGAFYRFTAVPAAAQG